MKDIELELNDYVSDQSLGDDLDDLLSKRAIIKVWNDPGAYRYDEMKYPYGLWIEYGPRGEGTMMFEVDIDELEMFATALLKSIELFRLNNSDVIRERLIK